MTSSTFGFSGNFTPIRVGTPLRSGATSSKSKLIVEPVSGKNSPYRHPAIPVEEEHPLRQLRRAIVPDFLLCRPLARRRIAPHEHVRVRVVVEPHDRHRRL